MFSQIQTILISMLYQRTMCLELFSEYIDTVVRKMRSNQKQENKYRIWKLNGDVTVFLKLRFARTTSS